MTDIVIPLTRSRSKDIEIRYALRSIEKHLIGVGNVFIVGYCPEWVTGIINIPADDKGSSASRDRNIMNKIFTACNDIRVSDIFLMYHDDHYLLTNYDAANFPNYHTGPMIESDTQYGKTKKNTINNLGPVDDYDCHCPILINKEMFLRSVPGLDWRKRFGYCIKTVYCHMNGIIGEQTTDLKIRYVKNMGDIRSQLAGRKWFSIGERAFNNTQLIEVLNELYPGKSKYEI